MEEQLILFETAKLAKEKGFWLFTDQEFTCGGELNFRRNCSTNRLCSAPTQSLLQKWLREVHHLCVTIEHYSGVHFKDMSFTWRITGSVYFTENEFDVSEPSDPYDSYEEALEIGLFEALKLIK